MSIGDVKTITLGKIFSMELAQYGEDVDEIVVCADSASVSEVFRTSTLGRWSHVAATPSS